MPTIRLKTSVPGPRSRELMHRRDDALPRGVYSGVPIFVAHTEGVEVEDVDGGRRELRLVGADEADASRGWVRVDSPLGAALLGRQAGDSVLVERPRDTLELKILRVHAGSGDAG